MAEFPRREGPNLVVTAEQAASVRRLRVDEGYTFRALAKACAEAWYRDGERPEWWQDPSNQYIGTLLCFAALEHFPADERSKWF